MEHPGIRKWSPAAFRAACEGLELSSENIAQYLRGRGFSFTGAAIRGWWTDGSMGPIHQAVVDQLVCLLAGLSKESAQDWYTSLRGE